MATHMQTLTQNEMPSISEVIAAKDAENERLRAALENLIRAAHEEGNFVTRGMQDAKAIADAALRGHQQSQQRS